MELSNYAKSLDVPSHHRYLEKISLIGVDPYTIDIKSCSKNMEDLPKTRYPDIVNFLLYTKNAFTFEEIKNYKSLEAYNQMVCGWIKNMGVKVFGDNIIVLGKVMHSQRLNERLLSPWIIINKEGAVQNAHCDCLAGVGESCTHVAAILFQLDKLNYEKEECTRTGKKAYWMALGTSKTVEPKRILDVDFRSPKRRVCEEGEEEPLVTAQRKRYIPSLSTEEKESLLRSIKESTSQGSVSHLLVQPFAQEIRTSYDEVKKYHIMSLHKPEYESKSLMELQILGTALDLSIPLDECKNIERATVTQSKSKTWFAYRAGRITASKFKSCCRTSLDNPSISLITSVCYPSRLTTKVRSLQYGCQHEKEAIKDFVKKMNETHTNFDVEQMGLFINPNFPYFGATPDGNVHCDCCGLGILEIKCPYCARRSGVLEKLGEKTFFFKKEGDEIIVDTNHAYYYQVQMQLAITKAAFCYLVAWSRKDMQYVKVELQPDFWERESERAKQFFYEVIIPEALGKYFTRREQIEQEAGASNEQDVDWEGLQGSAERHSTTSSDEGQHLYFFETALDPYEEEVRMT